MTKSELIERLAGQQSHVPAKAVEDAVKEMLEHMAATLADGERIEIRGFGSFSLHYRAPRVGRNPKTGDKVELDGKYVPHFKPGKELRDRANIKRRPQGAVFFDLNAEIDRLILHFSAYHVATCCP